MNEEFIMQMRPWLGEEEREAVDKKLKALGL